MTMSVAMAAYNGALYIEEQIKSILPQLKEDDEIVISLNPSSDNTEEIIQQYTNADSRIKLILCEQKGVLPNFENAIKSCKNDIVFLADQDDIWANNKVERQLSFFKDSSIGGVCHGCKLIDSKGQLLSSQPALGENREINQFGIIWKNPVQGSCLAFRKEIVKTILPFPGYIPMHDSWIGLWICTTGRLLYINEPLLQYRQHDGTVTVRQHKHLFGMISDRIKLVTAYILKRIAKEDKQ